MKTKKKEKDSHSRFFKEIEYNRESWIRDFLFGQKGTPEHGHMSLSGSAICNAIGSVSDVICKNEIIGISGVTALTKIVGSENGVLWFLKDENTDKLIINGSQVSTILPNNCNIINKCFQ